MSQVLLSVPALLMPFDMHFDHLCLDFDGVSEADYGTRADTIVDSVNMDDISLVEGLDSVDVEVQSQVRTELVLLSKHGVRESSRRLILHFSESARQTTLHDSGCG